MLRKQSKPSASLTLGEVEMLLKCYLNLERLEAGEIQANTDLRRQFVLVCRGEIVASTPYEIAYCKWRKLKPDLRTLRSKLIRAEELRQEREEVERVRENKRRLALQRIEREAKERDRTNINKNVSVPTRIIKEWGTRDDYRRDRSRWPPMSLHQPSGWYPFLCITPAQSRHTR